MQENVYKAKRVGQVCRKSESIRYFVKSPKSVRKCAKSSESMLYVEKMCVKSRENLRKCAKPQNVLKSENVCGSLLKRNVLSFQTLKSHFFAQNDCRNKPLGQLAAVKNIYCS